MDILYPAKLYMDSFQTTVIVIALVALILVLVIFGLSLYANQANLIYPPSSIPCPNYWQMKDDGTCVIPENTSGSKTTTYLNMGTWVPTTNSIPGLDTTLGSVNFSDQGWGTVSSGLSATCAKQKWANQYGILWDGVTNYNGCS